jgi:hypothetical protein
MTDARDLPVAAADYAAAALGRVEDELDAFIASLVQDGEPEWMRLTDALGALRDAARKLEAVQELRPLLEGRLPDFRATP